MATKINIDLKIKWQGSDIIVTPINPVEPELPTNLSFEKPLNYLSLEDFGGNAYYKRIDSGLSYSGNIIISSLPIFTQEDLGKNFCGLFAHNNPQEINMSRVDEFYPNIIGSRYSKIIEVISPTKIKVDFTYNVGSNKGYIFYDNSEAYNLLMDAYVKDSSIGIWLHPNKTYVVRQFSPVQLPKEKDFIITSTEGYKSYLKLGVEDYFKWNKKIGSHVYNVSSHLFNIGVSDKNFISNGIVYLPPHRRVSETSPFGTSLFYGGSESIGEQSRVISIIGNTALDEMRSIGDKVTQELFYGIGLGFIFAGGTYTGDGSKITDDVKDYLYVHIKDFEHKGNSFSDLKANLGGGLMLVAENVYTNCMDEEKYAPTSVKMKGRFSNNYSGIPIIDKTFYPSHILEITSGNSWYQTSEDSSTRGWNNFQELIHIDKYVLWKPSGNYWKYLYETWFNKGVKNNWYVEEGSYNFFTGKKLMLHHIPRKNTKYWIARKYEQTDRTIGKIIPNQIKGMVNWAMVQNVNWDKVINIPSNALPIQFQPNDKFKIVGSEEVYTVISTDRDIHPLFMREVGYFGGHDSVVSYFPVYTLDKNLPTNLPISFEIEVINSELEPYLDGREFEFYSVYKANKYLNGHTVNTKFGDANILESNPFGHVSYNHSQISVWAKNWSHNGFYRQSDNSYSNFPSFTIPEGKTEALRRWSKMHTYINCNGFVGQFDPSFNFWIRDAVYRTLGKSLSEQECVRLYGCTNMNGLENKNDKYVKNLELIHAPPSPLS